MSALHSLQLLVLLLVLRNYRHVRDAYHRRAFLRVPRGIGRRRRETRGRESARDPSGEAAFRREGGRRRLAEAVCLEPASAAVHSGEEKRGAKFGLTPS